MARGGKDIGTIGGFDLIEDPGLVGPPTGGRPEFFPKVEFHKNEGELFEEIKVIYEELGGDIDDLNVVELLLPAVQQAKSLVFIKDSSDAQLLGQEEEEILSYLSANNEGDVLLPAVQSADELSDKAAPNLLLKIDGIDGETQDMPEQSVWTPLGNFSDDLF